MAIKRGYDILAHRENEEVAARGGGSLILINRVACHLRFITTVVTDVV